MVPLDLPRRRAARGISAADDSGRPITLGSYSARQRNLLLFLLHGGGSPDCVTLSRQLDSHLCELKSWDPEILVVRSTPDRLPGAFPQAFASRADSREAYAPTADVAIAALDFRGRLMDGWSLKHPEPVDWREVIETVRWVAIQEPECGTCVIAPGWDG